ncbi:MAG: hypothetical protein Q8912_15465, partial [Bacillota bacterium]|nr:hypothetical protein [Bacillota bacterium]
EYNFHTNGEGSRTLALRCFPSGIYIEKSIVSLLLEQGFPAYLTSIFPYRMKFHHHIALNQ